MENMHATFAHVKRKGLYNHTVIYQHVVWFSSFSEMLEGVVSS